VAPSWPLRDQYGQLNPFLGAPPAPPVVPPTGATRELWNAAAGALGVGLPTTIGKGLQLLGADELGAGMVGSAQARLADNPALGVQPAGHGPVLNSVARVIAGSGAFLPSVAAGLAGQPELAVPLFYAGATGAGLEAGQDVREAVAQAPDNTPAEARMAGFAGAGAATAFNLAGGKVAGALLGSATNPLVALARGMIGRQGSSLAASTLADLTGTAGSVWPVLKQLPLTAAETVGVIGGQNAALTAIQRGYGVQGGPTPGEAFVQSVPDALTTAGLFSGVAMRTRGVVNAQAQVRTARLASADTDPALRGVLADQYAAALAKVDPTAAAAFRANAQVAISTRQPLPVDANLFQSGSVQPPPPPPPPPPPMSVQERINQATGVTAAPPPLDENNQPLKRKAFATTALAKDPLTGQPLTGQALAQAWQAYQVAAQARAQQAQDMAAMYNAPSGVRGNDPKTGLERELSVGELMDVQAGGTGPRAVRKPGNEPWVPPAQSAGGPPATPPGAPPTEPPGGPPTAPVAPIAPIAPAVAPVAPAPTVPSAPAAAAPRAPDAPKAMGGLTGTEPDTVHADIQALASPGSTLFPAPTEKGRPQSIRNFQMAVAKLGLDQLPTHDAQIAALRSAAEAIKSPDSPTRDRLNALAEQWEAAKPTVEAKPETGPQAGQTVVWRNQDTDIPVKFGEVMPEPDQNGAQYARVQFNGQDSWVPLHELHYTQGGAVTKPVAEVLTTPYGRTLPMPTDPALRAKAEEYTALKDKLNTQGLSSDEHARMNEQSPWRPSDELVAQKAREAGVPADWLGERPGFFHAEGYQSGRFDPNERIKGAYDVEQAGNAVHRAYQDPVRATAAVRAIDEAQPTTKAYDPGKHVDALNAEAERITQEAQTPGTFENKLRESRDQAQRDELNARYERALKEWVGDAADYLDGQMKQGLLTPEEWFKVTGDLYNAKSAEDALDILDHAGSKAQQRGEDFKALKDRLAANDDAMKATGEGETKPATEAAPVATEAPKNATETAAAATTAGVTVKRAQDFKTTGNHEVTVDGQTGHVFKDDETGNWYRELAPGEDPNAPWQQRFMGFNKGEAVKAMAGVLRARATVASENIPESGPDTAGPPAHVESAGENLGPSLEERRGVAVGKLTALITKSGELLRSLRDIKKNPEAKFTELQQRRFDDAIEIRKQLMNDTGADPGWTEGMLEQARKTETPYKKGDPALLFRGNPDYADPAILAPAIQSHRLSDLLTHLSTRGSEPWVRQLADRLGGLKLDTTLYRAGPHREGDDVGGEFLPESNSINIHPGGESERVVLHEAVHAGLYHTIEWAKSIDVPRNQREALAKQGLQDIETIRQKALKVMQQRGIGTDGTGTDTPATYGLTNVHEFFSELNTRPEFQQMLREQGTQKSWWDRTLDAARKLLGMPVDARDALEKAMAINDVFFGAAQEKVAAFNRSPVVAARLAGPELYSRFQAMDRVNEQLDLARVGTGLYRTGLGWKTVDYIASRMQVMPEMVRSGFAAGANLFRGARDMQSVVHTQAAREADAFGRSLQKIYRALPDAAAQRKQDAQLGRLAGESRGGDIRYNYADNVARGAQLDPVNKAYYDALHREFTQLQHSSPAAADALIRGQLGGRKMLDSQVATIVRGVLGLHGEAVQRTLAQPGTDPGRAAAAQGELALVTQHGPRLDIGDAGLQGARNPDVTQHYDGASAALQARLAEAFTAAKALPAGSTLRSHLAGIEQLYRAQAANPYFSLGRTGDYFVNVHFKDVDAATQARLEQVLSPTNKVLGNLQDPANDHAYMRFGSIQEAQAIHDQLVQAGGGRVVDPSFGKVADQGMINVKGTSQALRQMFADLDSMVDSTPGMKGADGLPSGAAQALKATLQRSMLSLLPETAARSAKIQRQGRGVSGYDNTFAANYQRRADGAARDTAQLYAANAYSAAFRQMRESVERMNRAPDPDVPGQTGYSAVGREKAQDTLDELNRRHAESQMPSASPVLDTIRAVGSTFYLAFSPAFIIRTQTQPWLRGLPITGSQFGFGKAAPALAKAQFEVSKIFAGAFSDGWKEGGLRGAIEAQLNVPELQLPAADKEFFLALHDRDALKLGQLGQAAQLNVGVGAVRQMVTRLAGITAQLSEMNARGGIGLSAFRLAEARHPGGSDPAARRANIDYAAQVIKDAMDDFSPGNTARQMGKFGFLGKGTPMLTQFTQYNAQTTQQLVRTAWDGFGSGARLKTLALDTSPAGLDALKAAQQQVSQAKREFAGLIAMNSMAAGALGLPFANALAGAYNWLTSDDDRPDDVRMAARRFFDSLAGRTGGGALAHGLPSLLQLDSSSLGNEDLLPFSEFIADRRRWADRSVAESARLLGPALNVGIDIGGGLSKIHNGNWIKGIEAMLPAALKTPYKAAEIAGWVGPGGYTDARGNPLPLKPEDQPGAGAIALQGLGFRTAARADQSETQFYQQTNETLRSQRRAVIADHVFKASGAGAGAPDADGMRDATAEIDAYNTANPTNPIMGVAGALRERQMRFAIGESSGLGMALSRRELPGALAQRYGAMPGGQ
jgi:hypothetical protein